MLQPRGGISDPAGNVSLVSVKSDELLLSVDGSGYTVSSAPWGIRDWDDREVFEDQMPLLQCQQTLTAVIALL